MKNVKDKILMICFCAFIGIMPLLFFILPKSFFSADEKRVLEKSPDFSVDAVLNGKYQKGVEQFLSDHFPARKGFIALDAYYRLYTGRNGTNGIYKGSDGYLINTPVSMDDANLRKNLNTIRSFAEKTDIPVFLTVVPSTGYILGDKLPLVHETYNDDKILTQAEKSLSPAVKYIDLCEALRKEGKDNQIYYRTDHHWTSIGAFTAYNMLSDILEYEPLKKSDFKISKYNGFYGTTYSKSALWGEKPDTIELWRSNANISVEIYDDNKKGVTKSRDAFFTDRLKDADKYPVYLDSNHSLVKIKNSGVAKGKLLIIKDSFANCLAPFIMNHYNEIYMVDLRYYRKNTASKLIKDNGINQVLIVYGIDDIVNDKNIMWLK